jgi:hypothetical protein
MSLAAVVAGAGAHADMYPNAANAKLPDARINLGAGAGDGQNLVTDFKANKNGTASAVTALQNALQAGGTLYVPAGNYLIPNAGADAGGVDAVITKSLHVVCAPGARFFTDSTGVDNDMIRISVPSDGAGLPTDKKITVEWDGCLFDQQEQQRSTNVPFSTEYPAARMVGSTVTATPAKQGTSATSDGLSIRGEYTTSGGTVYHNGFASVVVRDAKFYAGSHWQVAGGDGGLFVNGADRIETAGIDCIGSRDQCVYTSGSADGNVSGRVDIHNSIAKNSFGAFAIKRSVVGFSIRDNEIDGSVLGAFVAHVIGNGGKAGTIAGNTFKNTQVLVRADQAEGIAVVYNGSTDYGAYLADGTTPVTAYAPTGILFAGVTRSEIAFNHGLGVTAGYTASNPWFITLAFDVETGLIPSNYNNVHDNISTGFRAIGGETVGQADYNLFERNYEFTGAVPNIQFSGAHTSVRRFDYSTGSPITETPVFSFDGSVAAPSIARSGDHLTGFYWGTNTVGVTRPLRLPRTILTPTGSTQTDAAPVTGAGQVIRMGSFTAGQGIRLPTCNTGTFGAFGGTDSAIEYTIINDTAVDVLVWPDVGSRIMPGTTNAAFTQSANTMKKYVCGLTGSWYQ